jgi:hypothetical protein
VRANGEAQADDGILQEFLAFGRYGAMLANQLRSADLMRSRLSLTAVSGGPTTLKSCIRAAIDGSAWVLESIAAVSSDTPAAAEINKTRTRESDYASPLGPTP